MKKLSAVRKIAVWLAAVAVTGSLAGCAGTNEGDQPAWMDQPAAEKTGVTLNVYNWGEYIDDETYRVNEAFTHLTASK